MVPSNGCCIHFFLLYELYRVLGCPQSVIRYPNSPNFFYLNSNFDQGYTKKIKKAILYGKINYNNAKHVGTNMMSQIIVPIHSTINPRIYYQQISELSTDNFGNFYLGNRTGYGNSDLILRSLLFTHFLVGRMVRRWTAEKKRRKNFV